MRTVIEVGANWGTDTERLATKNTTVYAFEPTPQLVYHLKDKFKNNTNVHIVDAAVDEEEGEAKFNIAGTRDWGCSSLYDFTDDIHEKWLDRPDFHVTETCIVNKVRLDNFIIDNEIESIDYIWIDAQGNDFRVLKSLGDKIYIVQEGKCEGSYTVDLYQNTSNNVNDICDWLCERGFTCKIVPDNVGKEADVHFKRSK
jgi:FkbM family methyltransferase